MKTFSVTLLACIIGFYASAQKLEESKVPSSVLKAFKAKYASVKSVKWEKEGADYEASFELNKVETSTLFDISGNLLEVESEIKKADLPKAIAAALAKDYVGYEIEETAKIESKGVITYEAEVEKGEKSIDLIFDLNGQLLKKIEKEEKD
jgi:hypothetical protein